MPPRYQYLRMEPVDLSDDLNKIGITAGQFSRISGARYERVKKWIDGKEDIPPFVPVLCALLKLPGALAAAKATVDFYIEKTEESE